MFGVGYIKPLLLHIWPLGFLYLSDILGAFLEACQAGVDFVDTAVQTIESYYNQRRPH